MRRSSPDSFSSAQRSPAVPVCHRSSTVRRRTARVTNQFTNTTASPERMERVLRRVTASAEEAKADQEVKERLELLP